MKLGYTKKIALSNGLEAEYWNVKHISINLTGSKPSIQIKSLLYKDEASFDKGLESISEETVDKLIDIDEDVGQVLAYISQLNANGIEEKTEKKK